MKISHCCFAARLPPMVTSWLSVVLLLCVGNLLHAQQLRSYPGVNQKVGVMDSLGNVITPAIYKYAAPFGSKLCLVQTAEGVGLIDAKGRTVVKPHYIGMGDLKDGLSWVGVRDSSGLHFGYINEEGREVIPLEFSNADDFHDGMARVEKDGKIRFINQYGQLAFARDFDKADVFHGDVAAVYEDGLWGVINRKGIYVIPPNYQLVSTLPDGKTIIGVPDKDDRNSYNAFDILFGLADENGDEIIPPIYHDVGFWSEGVLCVKLNRKWGLIDSTGTMILAPTYREELREFDRGYTVSPSDTCLINKRGQKTNFGTGVRFVSRNDTIATIRKGKLFGFARLSGEIIVEPIYEEVSTYSEGFVAVKADGKWGFLNLRGEAITAFIYSGCSPFSCGRAAVSKNDPLNAYSKKSGFIDTTGKVILPLEYDRVYPFKSGFAIVVSNNFTSLIDSTGKVILSGKDIRYPNEGMIPVYDGKWGFADLSGKMVIPCKFDDSQYFSEGFAAVMQGGKWGFIDRSGASITPFIYNRGISSFDHGFAKVYSPVAKCEVLLSRSGVEIGVTPPSDPKKNKQSVKK